MAEPERIGIEQLDRLVGPIPPGSSIAIVADPGLEAEVFLYQAAHEHLRQGRHVFYAVFNRASSAVKQGFRDLGFDTADSRLLQFLDIHTAQGETNEPAAEKLHDPQKLVDVLGRLKELPSGADSILILDGLPSPVGLADPKGSSAIPADLHSVLKQFRLAITLLSPFPQSDESDRLLHTFDTTISLRGVEERVLFSQYFVIEHVSWRSALPRNPIPFRVIRPGGVFVYIPKVVVTGPYHAGKSTFVQTLSDNAVSVNRLGTTVALDHGHVTVDGLTTDIFGTPGQERFDPLLKTIIGHALGVIVVVDSTRPDSFPRAREMMELTGKEGRPMIVAANKQDAPGALSPQEVARRLSPPAHVRVIGCIGQDRGSSRAVLRQLIDQIMANMSR